MIRNMIEAATWAPSGSNRQPWRFIVLRDAEVKRRLADDVRRVVTSLADAVQPGLAGDFEAYSRHFLHFEQAPVLLLVLCRTESTMATLFRENTSARARMGALESDAAVISVAMATQNLLLTATEQGLASCVMTGPLVAEDAFDQALDVPTGWRILCMVCVGYPGESPVPGRRKAVDQVIVPLHHIARGGDAWAVVPEQPVPWVPPDGTD